MISLPFSYFFLLREKKKKKKEKKALNTYLQEYLHKSLDAPHLLSQGIGLVL